MTTLVGFVGLMRDNMHKNVKDFFKSIRKVLPRYFWFKDVLDVGSRDINGNNKWLFNFCNYTGVDEVKGKNVHLVMRIHEFAERTMMDYDVEHDQYCIQSLKAMYDLLKPGGLLIITAAGKNRARHMDGYYKNVTKEMLMEGLQPDVYFGVYGIIENAYPSDIYFFGIKGFNRELIK
jgi:hypothetical protein